MKNQITRDRLVEVLDYNPETGDFFWKNPTKFHPRMIGQKAGCNTTGYTLIKIDTQKYGAHRLAWLYVHGVMPDKHIDHADGNPFNNAISNLREATIAQNIANARLMKNKILPKGVRINGNGYTARISFEGRLITIGTYQSVEEAADAYLAEARRLYGEFARAG